MALFISVINHNHDKMICENPTIKNLAGSYHVILKSNSTASEGLKQYCSNTNIHFIQGKMKKGFGANNNEIYKYCKKNLGISDDDYFLVMNPDIEIELETIVQLMKTIDSNKTDIATINLFSNREMTTHDNSIRYFPSIINPIKSILNIKRTDHYDKTKITHPINVDWAAGSFLLFSNRAYSKLEGFDERYFMYFEDVDICRRARTIGYSVTYYPNYQAKHFAQHNNRTLLSKSFFYYLSSMCRYFWKDKTNKFNSH